MKTVLIYVISAQSPPYGGMIQQAMDTWDADCLRGVATYYYCGNPVRENSGRIVYFPVDESLESMGRKDILAYQWALENLEWDYMARVNASCYVHKARLLAHVQELPDTGVFRGVTLGPTYVCGTTRNWMWGGAQFIISRDVVKAMVEQSGHWRHDVMEDVGMSELVQDLGFQLDGNGRSCSINKNANDWTCVTYGSPVGSFSFTDFSGVNQQADQFFYRCKHDADRTFDATIMKLLKQHLPNV